MTSPNFEQFLTSHSHGQYFKRLYYCRHKIIDLLPKAVTSFIDDPIFKEKEFFKAIFLNEVSHFCVTELVSGETRPPK